MEQSSTQAKGKQAANRVESDEAGTQSHGKARSTLKATGKVIGKGLGLDVIVKDSKRLRSRFPSLWADIFSGRWRDVDKEHRETSNAGKTSTVALILTLMTVAMAAYWVFLFVAAQQQEVIRWMPLIALGILVIAGTFQSACYWYIATLQRRQERDRRSAMRKAKGRQEQRASTKQGRTA